MPEAMAVDDLASAARSYGNAPGAGIRRAGQYECRQSIRVLEDWPEGSILNKTIYIRSLQKKPLD
jgi:hypothetical protein